MKKSWHPGLIRNRAQVWEDQHAALQERKRIEALKKEIEDERAASELRALNEAAGAPKRQERVEFLYAGPGAGGSLAEDREAYLLGKKRIDDVLGKDSLGQDLGKTKEPDTSSSINLRDLSNKVSMDPLLAIKKQEAAQYEAMLNRKKAEMEAEARKAARRDARRGNRHSSREREHRHRDEHRYRSSRRDRSRSDERSRERRSGRRDDSRDRHRSRHDERHRSSRRSRSREHEKRRSQSHSRSPVRDRRPRYEEKPLSSEDRAAKLAAMTAAASDLDQVRDQRLAEARQREELERTTEDAIRRRDAQVGNNKGGFVRNMQLSAGLVR